MGGCTQAWDACRDLTACQWPPCPQVTCNAEQLAKVRGDLAIVDQNAQLLSELVASLAPEQRANDSDLIPDIAKTCRAMQERILELCQQISNEDLIGELLYQNDLLNDVLTMHAQRVAQDALLAPAPTDTTTTAPPHAQATHQTPPTEGAASAHPPTAFAAAEQPLAAAQRQSPGFDMFAQARATSWSESNSQQPGYLTNEHSTEMGALGQQPDRLSSVASFGAEDALLSTAGLPAQSSASSDHTGLSHLPDIPGPAHAPLQPSSPVASAPTAADMFDPLTSSASPWQNMPIKEVEPQAPQPQAPQAQAPQAPQPQAPQPPQLQLQPPQPAAGTAAAGSDPADSTVTMFQQLSDTRRQKMETQHDDMFAL